MHACVPCAHGMGLSTACMKSSQFAEAVLRPLCLIRLTPEAAESASDGSRPLPPGTELHVAGWGATDANTLSPLLLVNDRLKQVGRQGTRRHKGRHSTAPRFLLQTVWKVLKPQPLLPSVAHDAAARRPCLHAAGVIIFGCLRMCAGGQRRVPGAVCAVLLHHHAAYGVRHRPHLRRGLRRSAAGLPARPPATAAAGSRVLWLPSQAGRRRMDGVAQRLHGGHACMYALAKVPQGACCCWLQRAAVSEWGGGVSHRSNTHVCTCADGCGICAYVHTCVHACACAACKHV